MLAEVGKSLSIRWGDECRLVTINANGVRTTEKRDALALFLIDFRIAVCVVS